MLIVQIKKIVPAPFIPVLKRTKAIVKGIINLPFTISHNVGTYYRTRRYKGFKLAYTRGYSLITRLQNSNTYEPALTNKLVELLMNTKSVYFLDIGANIGLISLNIVDRLPDIRIFSFEPGPLTSSLLEKTVHLNSLSEKISVYNFALGEKAGTMQFAIHNPKHASGDGFLDTKRAGKSKTIDVKVDTLDNWWISNSKPDIKVVKIDTEGAELFILRGALEFVSFCKPIICIEINKLNLEPYPYNAFDILNWFNKNGYILKAFNGVIINDENFEGFLNEADEFLAFPFSR